MSNMTIKGNKLHNLVLESLSEDLYKEFQKTGVPKLHRAFAMEYYQFGVKATMGGSGATLFPSPMEVLNCAKNLYCSMCLAGQWEKPDRKSLWLHCERQWK